MWWEIVAGDSRELTVMPKGRGSEKVSALDMLLPGKGLKALKKFVVEAVIRVIVGKGGMSEKRPVL